MKKIQVLVLKEWSEVFKNRFVFFAVVFMPILFTAIPLAILYTSISTGNLGDVSLEAISTGFAEMCGDLSQNACNQIIVVTQFMPMFLMLPVLIPITIASYSIVGEKTTRTLEPLLATPITTYELLAGKGLAAALPAILATWLGFLAFVVGAIWLKVDPAVVEKFFDPLWLIAILVVGPLLALAAVSIAVMISSRTSDPRVAEQISGLFILPLVGLLVAQTTGAVFLTRTAIVWIAFFMAIIDAVLLAFAVQLFQRETILTRWK